MGEPQRDREPAAFGIEALAKRRRLIACESATRSEALSVFNDAHANSQDVVLHPCARHHYPAESAAIVMQGNSDRGGAESELKSGEATLAVQSSGERWHPVPN